MRTADLFAGCGGMSAGFRESGYELAYAAEQWLPAAQTFERNLGHEVERMDLGRIVDTARRLRVVRPDIIVGGPPCQEFSQAGTRVEAQRAKLTIAFAETIRAVRPAWFVMENVPEAQSSRAWAAARALLQEAGYGISEVKLNAAYFGVPQLRKRFFAVGRIDREDGFLDAALEAGRSAMPLSVRAFLEAEADRHGGDERAAGHFDVDFYYRHPRNWGRRAIFSLDEPSPTVRTTNRPVAPGYRPHPDDPAPSAGVRALTPRERARIQTLPLSHSFEGTRTDIDTMVANAVPTKLAAHIARAIMEAEMSGSKGPEDDFRTWLRETRDYTPRAAGDVLSRLRRVRRMLGEADDVVDVPEDALPRLRRTEEYGALSTSVRSQIKRAVELRQEWAAAEFR